ncbi:MAG TPA: hypothetical protein VH369_22335 [Bryobacteraceae bacterium]|jgi:hypothetical protein
MALDPSILTATAHPQIADPVEQMGRAAQFQNTVQQLQSGALQLQQQQRALAAQQALDQAMQKAIAVAPDGTRTFNHDAIANEMTQRGFGHLVPGLQESWTKADQARATLAKTNADLEELQRKKAAEERDHRGLLAQGIADANYNPDAAIAAIAHSDLDDASKSGLVQQIQANATPDFVKSLVDPIRMQSPAVQKLLTDRETAGARKQTAETGTQREAREQEQFAIQKPGMQAEALQKEVSAAAIPLAQAAEKGNYAQALAALPAEVQKYFPDPAMNPKSLDVLRAGMTLAERQTAAYRQQELGIQQARLGLERQAQDINKQRWGFEQGGGVSPQAQMIADGQVDPQTARAMLRNNPGLLGQVQKIAGPDFGFDKLQQRYGAIKTLAPGGTGPSHTAILALNTLVHHADIGLDAIDALNHNNFVPGNAAYDYIRQQTGSAAPNDFNTIKNFLSGEAAKVAQGGVPHEGEVKDAAAALATKNSPDQLRGALGTLLTIAGGRMVPMIQEGKSAGLTNRNSWDSESPDFTVVQPDTKAILQKRGYDLNTMKPIAKSAVPASIPANAIVQRSKSTGKYRYSTDGGKSWQTPKQ